MAERPAAEGGRGKARASKPVRRRPESRPRRRISPEALLNDLGASRPPCSVAEREIADAVARRLRAAGLRTSVEPARAPTSPTWAPLLRTLARVWGAAFLAAGWPLAATALAGVAIVGGVPLVAGLLRFVPLLGARSRNVVARRRGRDRTANPIIVVAHLDTHTTGGAPMHPAHGFVTAASAWLLLVVGVLGDLVVPAWRPVAAVVAIECVVTLAWLARRELETPTQAPDDNTSGVVALIRTAELLADEGPARDVWLVATGAGTSGSYGIRRFLKAHPDVRAGWVVEIDALGSGEMVAAPLSSRFPHPGTPANLVRAVAEAARLSGDPLGVRRVRRPHSDARAALRKRTAAIVLTGGLRPPAGGAGPDPANAERAARVVASLARVEP